MYLNCGSYLIPIFIYIVKFAHTYLFGPFLNCFPAHYYIISKLYSGYSSGMLKLAVSHINYLSFNLTEHTRKALNHSNYCREL